MVILFGPIPVRNENTSHSLGDEFKGLQKLFVFVQFLRVIFEVYYISALVLLYFSENHFNIQIGSLLDLWSDCHVCD